MPQFNTSIEDFENDVKKSGYDITKFSKKPFPKFLFSHIYSITSDQWYDLAGSKLRNLSQNDQTFSDFLCKIPENKN